MPVCGLKRCPCNHDVVADGDGKSEERISPPGGEPSLRQGGRLPSTRWLVKKKGDVAGAEVSHHDRGGVDCDRATKMLKQIEISGRHQLHRLRAVNPAPGRFYKHVDYTL